MKTEMYTLSSMSCGNIHLISVIDVLKRQLIACVKNRTQELTLDHRPKKKGLEL